MRVEGEKKDGGAGERGGVERGGEGTGERRGERKASRRAASAGHGLCDSRFPVPDWTAGRKCLTDERAHAAVTWGPSSPAKWGQVAGQLPRREEFRPSSLKYANEAPERRPCQPQEPRAFLEECPPPSTWSGQGAPATQWVRATS